jgi:riboflavin biosynthesis pyrimidine reductase
MTLSFELLLDEGPDDGPGLPEGLRATYGGDWRLPTREPYVYVNFVAARDGRVSFAEPGHTAGADVSGFDDADRWLMALLRARADAVLVGDGTLRSDPGHLWTADALVQDERLGALRRAENRAAQPLQVVLSLGGELPADAALLREPGLRVVVATTAAGAARAPAGVDVLAAGGHEVEIPRLVRELHERYAVRTVLCEGGPRVYGSLLRQGQRCDEFLTLSPLVLGDDGGEPRRPSLVEGARFAPGRAPRSRLLSVRRSGDLLFLRSRYEAP